MLNKIVPGDLAEMTPKDKVTEVIKSWEILCIYSRAPLFPSLEELTSQGHRIGSVSPLPSLPAYRTQRDTDIQTTKTSQGEWLIGICCYGNLHFGPLKYSKLHKCHFEPAAPRSSRSVMVLKSFLGKLTPFDIAYAINLSFMLISIDLLHRYCYSCLFQHRKSIF